MRKLIEVLKAELNWPVLVSGLPIVSRILAPLGPSTFSRLRTRILRLWGLKIGHGTVILGNPIIAGDFDARRKLTIGENCVLNWPLHLDINGGISIADRVYIGHHVVIITSDHEVGTSFLRCGPSSFKPVTIDSGAWIGARATIMPGVHIHEGAVVASGAVVGADVPANGIVAGNPARFIKQAPMPSAPVVEPEPDRVVTSHPEQVAAHV